MCVVGFLAAPSNGQVAAPDIVSDISTAMLLTDLTWACNLCSPVHYNVI